VSILLIFTVALAAFAPVFANERTTNQISTKETDRNSYYASVFQNLVDSFPTISIDTEYGIMDVVRYPDDYAGAYIDECNNLHIALTADTYAETEHTYQKILNDADVIFDTAKFSVFTLYEIQRSLNPVMEKFSIEATRP